MATAVPGVTLAGSGALNETRDRLNERTIRAVAYPFYLAPLHGGRRLYVVPVQAGLPLNFRVILSEFAYPTTVAAGSRQLEFLSDALLVDFGYFAGLDPSAPASPQATIVDGLAIQPTSDAIIAMIDSLYLSASSSPSPSSSNLAPWSQYTGIPAVLPSDKWLVSSVSGLDMLTGSPTNVIFSPAGDFVKWLWGFTIVAETLSFSGPQLYYMQGFLDGDIGLTNGFGFVVLDGSGTPMGDLTQSIKTNADLHQLPGTVARIVTGNAAQDRFTTVIEVRLETPLCLGVNGAADERNIAFSNGDSLSAGASLGTVVLEHMEIKDYVCSFGASGY